MTLGGSDRELGTRSANVFSCQPNPLKRSHFGKVTVEDESGFGTMAGVGSSDQNTPSFEDAKSTLPPDGSAFPTT